MHSEGHCGACTTCQGRARCVVYTLFNTRSVLMLEHSHLFVVSMA
jgi:hypothetical protein